MSVKFLKIGDASRNETLGPGTFGKKQARCALSPVLRNLTDMGQDRVHCWHRVDAGKKRMGHGFSRIYQRINTDKTLGELPVSGPVLFPQKKSVLIRSVIRVDPWLSSF